MSLKAEAYTIIQTEAEMIKGGNRPIRTTLRWLRNAVDLLEQHRLEMAKDLNVNLILTYKDPESVRVTTGKLDLVGYYGRVSGEDISWSGNKNPLAFFSRPYYEDLIPYNSNRLRLLEERCKTVIENKRSAMLINGKLEWL